MTFLSSFSEMHCATIAHLAHHPRYNHCNLAFGILRTLVKRMVFRCGGVFFSPSHHQKFNFLVFSPPFLQGKDTANPRSEGCFVCYMVQWHLYIGKNFIPNLPLSQKRFWSYTWNICYRKTRKPHSSGIVSQP